MRGAVSCHGDEIGIDPEFIHRLGHVFLIEQAELKLKQLRERPYPPAQSMTGEMRIRDM